LQSVNLTNFKIGTYISIFLLKYFDWNDSIQNLDRFILERMDEGSGTLIRLCWRRHF